MQYNDNEERLTPDQLDDDLNINNYAHSSSSPMQNALAQIGLGKPDTSPFLRQGQAIEALNAAQWQTRVAAIRSLGALKERAPIDLLIKSLGDEHGNVRVAAVRALATHSDQASVVSLTAALHDPEWYVRAAAAQSLGKMRGRIPIDELVQAVNDEDESVRAAAVWALGQAGIRAPVEPLLAALLDPTWLVREAAELALDELNIQELDRSPTNGEEQFSVIRDDKPVRSINKQRRFSFQRIVETGLVAAVLIILLASWIIIAQRPRTGSPGPSIAPAPVIYRGYTGGVYGGVYKLAWSPDGTLIASVNADSSVLVWDASTGKTVDHYTNPVSFVRVLSMVWLPHNYLLVLSERVDNTIDAWNPITGSVFLSIALPNSISVGAWSPDGQRIAFDAGDHTIQVWNVFSKQKIATHPVQTQANISALVWSTDGTQIASATYDGSIQIWKAATGRNASLPIKNMGYIVALSWSSDGTRLALATSDDSVQIWSKTSSGNDLQVLRHSTGIITPVVALAWSPGDLFLAASDNAQVLVWNATTGKQLMPYRGHTDRVNDLKWSADGTKIASAGLDKTVQVWLVS
jgi:WD40 repeat protein